LDNITLNLIFLAVFGLIVGAIFYFVRHEKAKNEQKIIQMAASHGWIYESIRGRLAWGLRLKSAQWTLEAISRSDGQEAGPGSTDIAMSTTWQADVPGSVLFIGERTSQANLGDIGNMLKRQVLQLALGAEAGKLAEIHSGSEIFCQKYLFLAQEPARAEILLTPSLESTLLAWKAGKPLIKRTPAGLTIELRGVHLKKADDILGLIELGELFL
jgi:hypothetical protein